MTIYFVDRKLCKICASSKDAEKQFGTQNGRKVIQRLSEMRAAETLSDMFKVPAARCHELKGDRKGRFAVDLKHPYRLVFKPENPVPHKPDGGIDTGKLTEVVVIAIEDYHG